MKNDINLLIKRKVKSYSSKNITVLLLIILLIGAIAYAGITLPSNARQAAKIKAAEVQKQLTSSAVDQKDIGDKTDLKARLDMQLAELNALKVSKADISKYVDAIERSRPSKIVISMLTTDSATTINLLGRADNDKTIALFCLRLREKNVFKKVFLSYSITDTENKVTTFAIVLTLPSTLDSTAIVQGVEKKDNVTASDTATGDATASDAAAEDATASDAAAGDATASDAAGDATASDAAAGDATTSDAAAGEENKQ